MATGFTPIDYELYIRVRSSTSGSLPPVPTLPPASSSAPSPARDPPPSASEPYADMSSRGPGASDDEELNRALQESAAQAQQDEQAVLDRILAESRADAERAAASAADAELAAALAASRIDTFEDEDAQVRRLLAQSRDEFLQAQKNQGAVPDDDEDLLNAIKERSMEDWHKCTWDNKPPAEGNWEQRAGIDLEPKGKGKGRREEAFWQASSYVHQSYPSGTADVSPGNGMGMGSGGGPYGGGFPPQPPHPPHPPHLGGGWGGFPPAAGYPPGGFGAGPGFGPLHGAGFPPAAYPWAPQQSMAHLPIPKSTATPSRSGPPTPDNAGTGPSSPPPAPAPTPATTPAPEAAPASTPEPESSNENESKRMADARAAQQAAYEAALALEKETTEMVEPKAAESGEGKDEGKKDGKGEEKDKGDEEGKGDEDGKGEEKGKAEGQDEADGEGKEDEESKKKKSEDEDEDLEELTKLVEKEKLEAYAKWDDGGPLIPTTYATASDEKQGDESAKGSTWEVEIPGTVVPPPGPAPQPVLQAAPQVDGKGEGEEKKEGESAGEEKDDAASVKEQHVQFLDRPDGGSGDKGGKEG